MFGDLELAGWYRLYSKTQALGIKVEHVDLGLFRLEALLDQYGVTLMLSISVK